MEFTRESVIAKRFSYARRRGYDTIAVDEYLEELAEYIGRLREDLEGRHASERSALELLNHAQRVADETIEAANVGAALTQRTAESRLAVARAESTRLVEASMHEAEQIVTAARAQADEQLAEAAERVAEQERDVALRATELERLCEAVNRFVNESSDDLRRGAARLFDMADHFQFESTARNETLDLRDRQTEPR